MRRLRGRRHRARASRGIIVRRTTAAITGRSSMRQFVVTSVALCAMALSTQAIAQAPPSYGETVNLEQAKKAATAAAEFAAKNGWAMAIAVVGPSGDLVYFTKMDNTQ